MLLLLSLSMMNMYIFISRVDNGVEWHGHGVASRRIGEVTFSSKQKKDRVCFIRKVCCCGYKWQCVDTMFIVNNESDMSSWKFGTFGWLSCDISISNRKIKPKWLRTISFNIHIASWLFEWVDARVRGSVCVRVFVSMPGFDNILGE